MAAKGVLAVFRHLNMCALGDEGRSAYNDTYLACLGHDAVGPSSHVAFGNRAPTYGGVHPCIWQVSVSRWANSAHGETKDVAQVQQK